ncbi:Cell wall-associated hydrolase, NlpC family [Sinosporangium album]|uniref:Cell wall-associated hydrolase, NlpC family n=1 Tax=Sinosporangium album TaxID=504805 RepID=A0A1G8FDM1_9ACTN|nr:C40 family peptidase [Sinosporangium album]SDH80238.1 Cell wall-associated hydrolase, NlpC family [Sinosporangium album]
MRFAERGTAQRRRVLSGRLVSGSLAACLVTMASAADASTAPAAALRANPTPSDVADARAAVRESSKELGDASSRLAAALAEKEDLAAEAGRLVEAYNGEIVRLRDAERAERAAADRLVGAGQELEEARRAVALVASESYGGIDVNEPLIALLAGGGGVAGMLHRASVLEHMGGERSQTVKRLSDAHEIMGILRRQATESVEKRREATERAEKAKVTAQKAVERQVVETERIEKEKKALEDRLDAARSKADRLARQRAAALERAKFARLRSSAVRSAAVRSSSARASTLVAGARSAGRMGDIAADWALTQLGKPYVWAADGPGSYDCSGLTMRAWEKVGVRLDHWTGTQWTSGPRIPVGSLRRGDLLFFGRITSNPGDIHHVGIYIGRGLMVHAPQTGDVVKIAPMWRRDLVGATRPVGRAAP